ncbi:Glycosyl transferase [Beijerinckiaceae bacterium RH AL1]|nr:glycosyltransferase [Beijerinckiaceae bacterium]VVB49823.1 Glycosyl transferase [Beijerinckiaceae bacterium RH CH11]VVB49900.1 Glycosyl transferase [Beijerinckiaceae bacterium RH AL8]VVC57094.1 Glycosyl transferase [Beijerinckiaceae bacterium RH AL1]
MSEDFAFTLSRRGTHALAGRTVLQLVPALESVEADGPALDVAGALAGSNARPLIAAPPGPLVSELQARGGVWLDFPTRAKNPIVMALAVRRLRALIAREKIDLIHARSRPGAWMALGAVRNTRVPLVTSLSHLAAGRTVVRHQYDSVMAKGDLVIVGSNYAAATVASLYPGAAGRIAMVRPGVDLKPFAGQAIAPARVQALRQAWKIAADERILLLAARPSIWKGHKVLLDATRLLIDMGAHDLRLVFLGEGKGGAAREVEQAITASGLGAIVRTAKTCADMPAALLAAAVVVVPSIEPESFGRISVEAQAVGTPVVVSDLGAVPETVLAPPDIEASRRTGWRVSPSDPGLLADAIGEALALGASSRDALALRARRHVEAHFSIERMARETLDAYAAVLARKATQE